MCCLKGHVSFASFTTPNEHPGFLKKFVKSPALLRKIRAYNNALVLTSMGAAVCDNVAVRKWPTRHDLPSDQLITKYGAPTRQENEHHGWIGSHYFQGDTNDVISQ
ncbi:hypothetical protein PHMEG_00029360 [Phytophthora megakarya]|uniref:Uncharacterized protein n=1 Tax=Phytophthora megakarya TaxID=4795 RepID=A0A225V298_9STRA|nr:hypothetical protein PHMEG_00029360 [Phytophthora megakarya]